jgi:DNA-binding transcriptional regulator LsrR (DeoR family)
MNRPKSRYRHMTPAAAREIRRAYFAREAKQAQIARRFGVKQNTVSRIVSGITWSHA